MATTANKPAKHSGKTSPSRVKTASRQPKKNGNHLSNEQFSDFVAKAAYYRAEKRRFEPGGEMQDWLDAENDISAQYQIH